jgi:4-hydroxy-tetrahydrodipicolinate reductase
MDIMAQNFPGAFAGYSLKVTESHQSSKVDTSGTAKAIVEYFQKLGVKFNADEVRSPPFLLPCPVPSCLAKIQNR